MSTSLVRPLLSLPTSSMGGVIISRILVRKHVRIYRKISCFSRMIGCHLILPSASGGVVMLAPGIPHRFALFISSMISRVCLTVLDHGPAWLKVVAYGIKTIRLASW